MWLAGGEGITCYVAEHQYNSLLEARISPERLCDAKPGHTSPRGDCRAHQERRTVSVPALA